MSGTIVITGCDVAHHHLAGELLASLGAAGSRDFALGFVQVGAEPTPATIHREVDLVVRTESDEFQSSGLHGFRLAYLGVKARLPELFPGFDTYVWLDGDTWLQNRLGLDQIVKAAQLADLAIHPQIDPNYLQASFPDDYTLKVYTDMFGHEDTQRFSRFPMCNGGVFGARVGSKLWPIWREALAKARDSAAAGGFLSDQIPLHRLIASGQLTIHPLRAVNNWLVLHAPPAIDFVRKRLVAPSIPYEEINIIHLVGAAKSHRYPLGADGADIGFRYPEISALFQR